MQIFGEKDDPERASADLSIYGVLAAERRTELVYEKEWFTLHGHPANREFLPFSEGIPKLRAKVGWRNTG